MKLNHLKKTVLSCEDTFLGKADDKHDIAILERSNTKVRKLGIFSLKGKSTDVNVDFPDGVYTNHLDESDIIIKDGKISCTGKPIVITVATV